MTDKPETTVILIHETILESAARDIISTLTLIVLIGVGVVLKSSAMQWIGFILAALWVIGKTTTVANKYRVTPQGAADVLKEKFGVTAK